MKAMIYVVCRILITFISASCVKECMSIPRVACVELGTSLFHRVIPLIATSYPRVYNSEKSGFFVIMMGH